MKKKIIGSIGTIGTLSLAGSLAISCASAETHEIAKDIFEITHEGKSLGKSTFEDVMKQIKESSTKNSQQISNIFNVSAKFLYNEEQKASKKEKEFREDYIRYENDGWITSEPKKLEKKIKEANIKALDTEEVIRKRIVAKFNDSKEAFKVKLGTKWGAAWGTELAKSYEGAKSDEEAIENLVVKEMRASAYLRYSISKESSKFTKGQLEIGQMAILDGDSTDVQQKKEAEQKKLKDSKATKDQTKLRLIPAFKWLAVLATKGLVTSSNKNKTLDSLDESDYITIISTNSFIQDQKDPSHIIGGETTGSNSHGYLNKFNPTYISHFLIKAVPDEKNRLAPWKISMDDLKKLLYSTDGKNSISSLIDKFEGVKKNTASGAKTQDMWKVSDMDKKILKLIAGNSPEVKKSGGSLSLQDKLDYVKSMDPAFGFPLLNDRPQGSTAALKQLFDESTEHPLEKLSEKLISAISDMPGNTHVDADVSAIQKAFNYDPGKSDTANANLWQDYVDGLISTQDEKKVLSAVGRVFKNAFGSANGQFRSVIYQSSKGKIVLSAFGIHIIQINDIQKQNAKETLINMIKNDIERELNGKTAFFNVLKELSKYSSDQNLIVKGLMENKEFITYLGKQRNFSAKATDDTFPKYDTKKDSADMKAITAAIKTYEDIFNEKRAAAAVKVTRERIQKQWFANELIQADNTRFTKAINDIYNNALAISKKGLVS